MELIKIPSERIKILNQAKKRVEKICKVHISIEEFEVSIDGDASDIYFAKDVVKAIGRGFEPDVEEDVLGNFLG